MSDINLPTKKQRETLNFIDGFIRENGYAPSFREVQRSLDLKSVSTVAAHVNGLIAKGYLIKRDGSARSLEVTTPHTMKPTWQVEFIVWSEKADLPEEVKEAVEIIKKYL